MQIKSISFSRDIIIKPIAERWFLIPHSFTVSIFTDCGIYRIKVKPGFMFDGRSGGPAVDCIAPNLGSQNEIKAWLLHDLMYYDIGFSFEETNLILYNTLRQIGYGWFRAKLIYTGVSTSVARTHFGEPKPTDKEFCNIGNYKVTLSDK